MEGCQEACSRIHNALRPHVMHICHLSLSACLEAADGAMHNKLTIYSAARRAVEGGELE